MRAVRVTTAAQRLGLAVAAQLLLAGGLLLPVAADRFGAREVTLLTQPVDPRDLLRGQYLTLGYALSRVKADPEVQYRHYAYVPLHEQGGVWTGERAVARKPTSGVFLRGRVVYVYGGQATLNYGLERYYLSEASALKMAGQSTAGLHARVSLGPSGRARLLGLSRNGVEIK